MAQRTKAKTTRQGSSRSTGGSQRSRSRSGGSRRTGGSSQGKPRRRTPSAGKRSSSNGAGAVSAAKDATVSGASSAGSAISSTAKRFKTPALVAGAGLAGLAGGIALTRDRRSTPFGIKLPSSGGLRTSTKKLNPKDISKFAERTGQVAERVRAVSDAISDGGSRPRSPIEVVLEGLTTRRRAASPD